VAGALAEALVVKLGPVEPTATLVLSALVCVGAAALSGTATPLLKRATLRMEPLSVTAGMHATAVLMLLPGALYDLPQAHFTWSAVAAVAVLGVATSGLAYWMFMRIIQHVPPMASMTANFMSTGFGVLWSVLLLDEPTSLAMAAGGGLIVLACLLVSNLNPLRVLSERFVTAPH
jgi:drug/metabolite transporter (DMT)-like permease